MRNDLKIETLWEETNFKPNESQKRAILHTEGPLYLTAGPGSGKTRVLLWRTLNLIIFHNVRPDEILLTTFTEKASHQLKEGIQYLLGLASNHTGVQYDLASMYIGTVHSICNRLIGDRRFYESRRRNEPIKTIDQLEQYFFLKKRLNWNRLLEAASLKEIEINAYYQKSPPKFANKHQALTECIKLFNRFSEERLDVESALTDTNETDTLHKLIRMYKEYRAILKEQDPAELCDLSLIQEKALQVIEQKDNSSNVFKYIIVDEYQDTNFIQEQLYFKLSGNNNICVVGDDDQALYRFRGSTVENFVEFPKRVIELLGSETTKIPLSINYRSRKKIVDFYTSFIEFEDWTKDGDPDKQYRVHDKGITAQSADSNTSVIYVEGEDWISKTAAFCKQLVDDQIVKDPNQIAFLFPSMTNSAAKGMLRALREEGLNVYAPRAGNFLEGQEATEIAGILSHIFDLPESAGFNGFEFNKYKTWINKAHEAAEKLIKLDEDLSNYIKYKRQEVNRLITDYNVLIKVVETNKWELSDDFDVDKMRRKLANATGLSDYAQSAITSKYLDRVINERLKDPNQKPFKLSQIINRATSLDWTLLDIFYQVSGFNNFKQYYDLAQYNGNEGPICNLSKIAELLTKFMELYSPILSASFMNEQGFSKLFFSSYLYTIYRLGESEYEDEDNPFPKGNIQFLTIHQSKGLEFPVVFMYPKRQEFAEADKKEVIIRDLKLVDGEPLNKINRFDLMRIFYVGLSRAEKLLILPKLPTPKQKKEQSIIHYVNSTLDQIGAVDLDNFDLTDLPEINHVGKSILTKPYSYTGDFLAYDRCPRQYMIFRKYGFTPSRSQTMFFGSLVHNTIEDLHQELISRREKEMS